MKRLAVCLAALAAVGANCGIVEDWSGGPDEFEPDGSRETAGEQAVNGPSVRHTLAPDGDEDWIRFRVTEVDTDPSHTDTGPCYYLQLLNVTGDTVLEVFDRQGRIQTATQYVPLRPSIAGIYWLRVTEDRDRGGEYRSWIALVKDDAQADLVAGPPEVAREVAAGSVSVRIVVRVTNQGGGDAGEFQVKAYASADRVLDPADDEIASASADLPSGFYQDVVLDGNFSLTTLAGPVYVLAKADATPAMVAESDEGNNVGVGSVLLGVTAGDLDGPDDETTDALADMTSGGARADQTLYPAGDVDLCKLVIGASEIGHTYEIWTDNLRGGADTDLALLDAGGAVVASAAAGGLDNFSRYLAHTFAAGDEGTYYVRVSDRNGRTGGYDLLVRDAGTAGADAFEPNDDRRTWRTLAAGEAPTQLTFSDDADEDWFVYAVSAGDYNQNVAHTIETVGLSGCDTVLDLYLHSEPVAKLTDDDSGTGAGASKLDFTGGGAYPASLYYVRVTCKAGSAGGTYGLQAVRH